MSTGSAKENNNKNTKKRKKRKKNSTKKKVLLTLSILALFIFSIIGGGFIYTYSLLDKMEQVDINKEDLGINEAINDKFANKEIRNIALLGIENLDGSQGRSDAIMILTIDSVNNKLKVSSIMRDSYVKITNNKINKMDKINHAHAFGGAELAIKTLNENFDLNITDFVSVDFSSLIKIIDSLGGMELTITQEEISASININSHIQHINSVLGTNSSLITKPGTYHVDGVQALSYSRIRYTSGGDSERTERQRIVLSNLFEKFKSTSPTKYPTLLNELLPLVKTSLSSNDILSLASTVFSMGNIQLEQSKFPTTEHSSDAMIDNIYYLKFDKEATIEELHKFIFDEE